MGEALGKIERGWTHSNATPLLAAQSVTGCITVVDLALMPLRGCIDGGLRLSRIAGSVTSARLGRTFCTGSRRASGAQVRGPATGTPALRALRALRAPPSHPAPRGNERPHVGRRRCPERQSCIRRFANLSATLRRIAEAPSQPRNPVRTTETEIPLKSSRPVGRRKTSDSQKIKPPMIVYATSQAPKTRVASSSLLTSRMMQHTGGPSGPFQACTLHDPGVTIRRRTFAPLSASLRAASRALRVATR